MAQELNLAPLSLYSSTMLLRHMLNVSTDHGHSFKCSLINYIVPSKLGKLYI